MKVAVSGDWILNRRVSCYENQDFLQLMEQFQQADISIAHFESIITEFEGESTYPAAEAGGTWMGSPSHIPEELDWAGVDMVSHASNHALDYSYGGLKTTHNALSNAGIPYAGTGNHLSDARSPTFLDTPHGRIALISATTSFPPWSRAGQARQDMGGRPGVNPLRFHHKIDPETRQDLCEIAEQLNLWVVQQDDEWILHPPGVHNSQSRFIEDADQSGVQMELDESDREGNLRSVTDAANRADFVVYHLHTHEWDPAGDLSDPPQFIQSFFRECIDAGADLVLGQGSHSPLRGIEIYQGRPIFYDPGDFFTMSNTVERLPAEFYLNFKSNIDGSPATATPSEGFEARGNMFNRAENPPGGYHTGSITATSVPVCKFENGELVRIDIYPGTWPDQTTEHGIGIPRAATGEQAVEIISELEILSEVFGTTINYSDGRGEIVL